MSSYWGAQDVNAVASNGVATQLFPQAGSIQGTMANTDTTNGGTYPPTPLGGLVRRPCQGRLAKLEITGDGTNPGTIEVWDVKGTDRGATVAQDGVNGANVNNGVTIANAYLTANGRLIAKKLVQGSAGTSFTEIFEAIPFNDGIAVRFWNSGPTGKVSVAAFVEGGFMLRPVVC